MPLHEVASLYPPSARAPLLIFLLLLSTCWAQQPFSLQGTYTKTGTTKTGYYFVPPSSTSTDGIDDGQDHLTGTFLFIASTYGPYCSNRIGSAWAPFQFTQPFPQTPDPTTNAIFTFTLMADGTIAIKSDPGIGRRPGWIAIRA